MSSEQKVEQQNLRPEEVISAEKSTLDSFDTDKSEQEPSVQERIDNNQITTQVQKVTSTAENQSTSTPLEPVQNETLHKQVDSILSEGMDNIFLSLDAGTQRAFKIKGEETSKKITNLLTQTKVKAKEITILILEWLRIIPQANKHYLEQEAKIKTGDIIRINKSE